MSIKHYKVKGAVSKQVLWVVLALAITGSAVGLLYLTKPEPVAQLQQLPALKVAILQVQRGEVNPVEENTGRLKPMLTSQLRFEVAGQIEQRLVEPGVEVEAGTALLQLKDEDFQDRLTQAESELLIEEKSRVRDQGLLNLAKKNLSLQRKELKRWQSLSAKGLVSDTNLDSARQQVFDLEAEVARLQYSVATAQARLKLKRSNRDTAARNLERTTLRAPFGGVVNKIDVQIGDSVSANQIVLTLVDVSALDLQLDVRRALISALQLDQEIEVLAETKRYAGKVVAIQRDPELSTNTHEVRIRLRSPDLLSGMLATAIMPLVRQTASILVPASAVSNVRDQSFVFVHDGDVVSMRPVQLGMRVGRDYTVTHGLQEGEWIVARDVAGLTDGQRVFAEQVSL